MKAAATWQRLGALILSTALAASAISADTLDVTVAAAGTVVNTDTLLSVVDQSTLAPLNELAPATAAGRFDASTVSSDGTVIAFTVYTPNIAVGNSAPLLLEGHGWGGKRTRDLDTTAYDDTANTPLQTAKLALDSGIQGGKQSTRGWYVISFDQRGFGDSGGFANMMDPRIEGKDVKAIIDWAQANLPRLAYRKNKDGARDPVVGSVGLSYGGGYQNIGAGVDKRIDAIVPTATWYDLRYSLYNEVPKSLYLSVLVGVGATGLGRIEPFIYQAFVDANTTGHVSADFMQRMYLHSAVSYCEGNNPDMQQPGIPAFFIQASNDTLFDLKEGFQAFECSRKSNPGSKLMAVRYGHPDVIINNSMPKFTEENIACGGASVSTSLPVARLAFSFLSQNLVDAKLDSTYSPDYLTVPDLRAVLEDGSATSGPKGETAERQCYEVAKLAPNPSGAPVIRRGGTSYPASPGAIQNVIAGVPAPLVSLIKPNDASTVDSPAMKAFAAPDAGQVMPLTSAFGTDRMLVGVPTVHLNIAAANGVETTTATAADNPPILFVGLVRQTADGQQQLVHDQVQPVKGFGDHDITLPGISMLLHGSDQLGLVVFGYHPQYFSAYTKVPLPVNLTGISVALPFLN